MAASRSILSQKKYKDILKRAQNNYAKQVADRDKRLKAIAEEDAEIATALANQEEVAGEKGLKTPCVLPPAVEAGPSPMFIFVPKKL